VHLKLQIQHRLKYTQTHALITTHIETRGREGERPTICISVEKSQKQVLQSLFFLCKASSNGFRWAWKSASALSLNLEETIFFLLLVGYYQILFCGSWCIVSLLWYDLVLQCFLCATVVLLIPTSRVLDHHILFTHLLCLLLWSL